jgi:hypothetical protein
MVWAREDEADAVAAELSDRFPDIRVLWLSVSKEGAGPA